MDGEGIRSRNGVGFYMALSVGGTRGCVCVMVSDGRGR